MVWIWRIKSWLCDCRYKLRVEAVYIGNYKILHYCFLFNCNSVLYKEELWSRLRPSEPDWPLRYSCVSWCPKVWSYSKSFGRSLLLSWWRLVSLRVSRYRTYPVPMLWFGGLLMWKSPLSLLRRLPWFLVLLAILYLGFNPRFLTKLENYNYNYVVRCLLQIIKYLNKCSARGRTDWVEKLKS